MPEVNTGVVPPPSKKTRIQNINLFANNDLTALTADDTDNAKTNTTIKKFKKSTTTTKEPNPASDRKSTRLNSSHGYISYAVFCLKKKKQPRAATVLGM